MIDNISDLEFAAHVVEGQFTETLSRYDTLNQKLSTYIASLTILFSILWIVIGLLLAKNGIIINAIQHIPTLPAKSIISLAVLLIGLIISLISSTVTIVRIIQTLSPITLQQIDDETILIALKQNKLIALDNYIRDMNSATEANREVIRDRMSLIFSINRWLIIFIIAFGLMFIAYIVLLFFFNPILPVPTCL